MALRDAAVDPEDTDFLPPEADSGISPGIHGEQGVHPITPGAVSSTADTQEAAETAHMAAFQYAIDSLAVTPATASIEEEATEQLTATATLIDAETEVDVTGDTAWESDDELIATVDAAGLVTGVADGEATITGTYRGETDTCVVTVTNPA